jgi:hypothetical protein
LFVMKLSRFAAVPDDTVGRINVQLIDKHGFEG